MATDFSGEDKASYLPTYKISLKSEQNFVDWRTDGRTFETHFIRSTRKNRPKNDQLFQI